jgi:rare lipoprotein A
MRRWLIILSLAAVQVPDVAMAAARSNDVSPLQRLINLLTPNSAPARRNTSVSVATRRHSVGHEPLQHGSSRREVPRREPERPAAANIPGLLAPLVGEPPRVEPAKPVAAAGVPRLLAPFVEGPFRDEPVKPGWTGECNAGQRVKSAYYWEGRHTASGQPFNPHGLTAAHRTLPFGTHLTVTNPRNGQSVTVVINDRGPFIRGVSLDLSLAAAKAIGMHGVGVVCIL